MSLALRTGYSNTSKQFNKTSGPGLRAPETDFLVTVLELFLMFSKPNKVHSW